MVHSDCSALFCIIRKMKAILRGAILSLILHMALLAALFMVTPMTSSYGVTGYGEGGIAVHFTRSVPGTSTPSHQADDGHASDLDEAVQRTSEPGGEKASPLIEDVSLNDAMTSEGAQNANVSVGGGGVGEAVQGLLGQIARCLPADFRPSLLYGQLALEFGPDGALTAAPSIGLPDIAPAADRAQADRIVQAAMQCAPYAGEGLENTTITLVPDFAGVQPVVQVADGVLGWVKQ